MLRYVIYRRHLDPSLSDAEVDAYAERLGALLRGQYPGHTVAVEVRERVEGVGAGLQGEPEGVDPGYVQSLADLALGSCSELGCPRPAYAHGLCEPHYRRSRRGSRSTGPVTARGTEPLRALSLRVPASVMDALGDSPGASARRVLERWAKRQGR